MLKNKVQCACKNFFLLLSTCCVLVLSGSLAAMAQGGLIVSEYDALKKVRIENLDKESYVALDKPSLVLDSEMKPAYTFNFSDKVPRKVYVYKIFTASDMTEIGKLAFYVLPEAGKVIAQPIPGATADREVWGKYIDDLKYTKEEGFLACMSFVLSKELSAASHQLNNGAEAMLPADDEYEYCFAADAVVKMADGSEKLISQVRPGEQVVCRAANGALSATSVIATDRHQGNFSIVKITVEELHTPTAAASSTPYQVLHTIEGTANHPVYTQSGKKPLGELARGDKMLWHDKATGKLLACRVLSKGSAGTAGTVYNLTTATGNFLVNGFVVFDKK